MQEHTAVDLFIDGQWVPAQSGKTFDLIDPATEEKVGTAAQADAADVAKAIEAAQKGFEIWRKTSPWQRAETIRKIAQALSRRADEAARRLTIECGKPLAQAKGEVQMSVETLDWFADEARRTFGQYIPGRTANQRFITIYQPVGIVAAFTAWNFPVALVARKIGPALAAGCSIISRPAEEGSGAVRILIECCIEAGVPAGVVNLLTGAPGPISDALMESDAVRKVTFTGSIPVGQHLMRKAADTVKRMSMELGGHAPVIVYDDVDVEATAKAAAIGKFRNNGQVCVSPTRFFIHESIAEKFTTNFVAATKALKIGHGLDEGTDVGPLINRRRRDAIEEMVETTIAEGAKVLTGGKRPADMNRGFFFEPTVFGDVEDDFTVMTKEPFGPLAPVTTFSTFDEVIARANRLNVGLASYVWTNSLSRAQETMEAIETGIVGVNTYAAATAEAPFGGIKHSGFGRENGTQGILDYMDIKFANMIVG